MAANVSIGVDVTTITVVITVKAGSGYDPQNANVQVTNQGTGMLVTADTDNPSNGGLVRTLTYTGAHGTGYSVSCSCGGEVGFSTVSLAGAMVGVR